MGKLIQCQRNQSKKSYRYAFFTSLDIMKRSEIDVFKYIKQVNSLMKNGGLLLVTSAPDRKPNAMTIGWGFLGTMWRRPVFIVAVRLSRYTYKLLENSKSFTVCLPNKKMKKILDFCGTESGRDVDKFEKLGITANDGILVNSPYIKECPVHFECNIVYKDRMEPGQLDVELEKSVYPNKDMHVIYYGEVKGAYAIQNVEEML